MDVEDESDDASAAIERERRGKDEEKKLKRALHYAVVQICQEEGGKGNFAPSKELMYAISDLSFKYAAEVMASDLEAFAKHAKRSTISPADVILMARKDPNIARRLEAFHRDTAAMGKKSSSR